MSVDFVIGIWGGAEVASSAATALLQSSWAQGFRYDVATTSWNEGLSNGVDITTSGNVNDRYSMTNGQMALRFGQDGYLYLFEVVSGGYSLVGKSNTTVAGTSVMIQFGGYMTASFPLMTERTETWEIVHDFDGSENGEWSDGLNEHTVIKSRMSLSPGQKVTMNLNHFGRGEYFGFGYNGAATGVGDAETIIEDAFFYNSAEALKDLGDWTWNTDATYYYNPNGDGSSVGYFMGNGTNIGLISIKYTDSNVVKLFHETNNELIATLTQTKDGSPLNVYFGSSENNHTADRIPTLTKFDMSAGEEGTSLAGWWYIESPNGNFEYPLFVTEAEANYIDSVEGGSGTSSSITYADDLSGNTWYHPTTSFVNNGVAAPQGGVFGNSINVVWNEQVTGADASYVPTFNNITYNVQEGSAINIQYKAAGMTDTFNITNVPSGYADNGFAIVGTAEDISNGYGQSVQHVINVTKANDFGSAVGTITINVLANLAGNEFTIIDKENGTIKFTQDGGITELDFNTVTFNAGSTYKFYLDHYSIESSDGLSVVDSSGNVLLGSEGLSSSGNSGDAGAYMQYVIPSDVAPGKFLRYYDNDTSGYYTDIPMILAGSTYTVTVTGVTSEGPQDLSISTEALNDQWYSVNETLSAGERVIFPGTFFTDLHNELQIGSSVIFGIKDGSWANTQDGNTASPIATSGFLGQLSIKFKKTGATGGTINVIRDTAIQGANVFYITSMLADYSAFIEITSSGNNVRMGVAHSSQNDPINDVYSNWNIAKSQTGEQGYGLTSIDVMAFYDRAGAAVAFDYDNVDWTLLSEIAVPTLVSNDTPWNKAIKFSGGNEYLVQVSTSNVYANALRMGGVSSYATANSDSSKTSNDTFARPWATAIVFQTPNNTGNQHIWNSGEGAANGDDNMYLRITGSNGACYFGWGREGVGYNEYLVGNFGGSYNQSTGQWWAVYISHDGTRLNSSNATAANLINAFDIRIMATNDGPPAFNGLYNIGNDVTRWTSTGVRMDRAIMGDFTIGGRGSNRSFHGKVASMVVTTLRKGVTKPTDAEIELMIMDPIKWEEDYRDGQLVRNVNDGNNATYMSSIFAGYGGTQIWLMGDGSIDAYAQGIRNQVSPSEQNYTKLQLNNMASNDIENVTIAGLS